MSIALSVVACETTDQSILDKDDQFEVYLQQGKAVHKKGNLEKALTHYEQALALKPSSDEIHYLIGFVYYKKYLQSHDTAGKRHAQEQLINQQTVPPQELTHENWEHIYEGPVRVLSGHVEILNG